MLGLRLRHVGEINFRQLKSRLTWTEQEQLPFATAMTLTQTAYQAQDEIKEKLPEDFILRNRHTQRGIRVRRATKRNLQSEVGSIDEYMVLQELGGKRQAKDGRIALPKAIRKDVRKLIRSNQRPGRVLAKSKEKAGQRKRRGGKPLPFVARMASGKEGIFVRRGKGRRPLDLLYVFEDEVTIKQRFGLRATAVAVARRNMQTNFNKNFIKANSTAR